MDITPLIAEGSKIIQSYGPGLFRVSGEMFEQTAIAVFPDRVEKWPFQGSIESIAECDFDLVLQFSDDIDIVLLGCGQKTAFVPPALRQIFRQKRISLEPMDTGAACRTYNVLLTEGRRVAALLLPV